jgi:hypothetical protein
MELKVCTIFLMSLITEAMLCVLPIFSLLVLSLCKMFNISTLYLLLWRYSFTVRLRTLGFLTTGTRMHVEDKFVLNT